MSCSSKKRVREQKCSRIVGLSFVVLLLWLLTGSGYAQVDPGIRSGPSGAGQAFASGLTAGDLAFFNNVAVPQFTQVEDVSDGLGPRFNLDSCAGCHVHPA